MSKELTIPNKYIHWTHPSMWKCDHCDIKYTNIIEWIFHRKVECPYWTVNPCAPDGRYGDSKKHRSCYRCGQCGHYYKKNECYAFKDVNGITITWGIRRPLPKKNKTK